MQDNKPYEKLTDLQWQALESLFPKIEKRGRGKPHTPWRSVLNSILFVLRTKTKWEALPKEEGFASKSASHRWFKIWKKNGFLHQILHKLEELSLLEKGIELPPSRNRLPKSFIPEQSMEEPLVATN